jgi:hypothetical protein
LLTSRLTWQWGIDFASQLSPSSSKPLCSVITPSLGVILNKWNVHFSDEYPEFQIAFRQIKAVTGGWNPV